MKSLKKVLALTSVVAMLGSYAAGAASVTIANKDENGYIGNVASGNIAIDYTYTPDAGTTGNQVTIIAFEDNGEVALDKEVPFAEGFDVAYINQIASDDVAEGETTVDGNFTFAMRNGLVDLANGEYFNVFVGGTNVATADRATFSYGTVATEDDTTYSVSGMVGLVVNFGEDYAEDNAAYAAAIDVCDLDYNVINTIDIDTSSIDPEIGVDYVPFTVDGLEKGAEYILIFRRCGACDKEVYLASTIADDVAVEGTVDFWATDMDFDFMITASDVNEVITIANAEGFDYNADADLDAFVTASDVNEVITSAKNFEDYYLTIE